MARKAKSYTEHESGPKKRNFYWTEYKVKTKE